MAMMSYVHESQTVYHVVQDPQMVLLSEKGAHSVSVRREKVCMLQLKPNCAAAALVIYTQGLSICSKHDVCCRTARKRYNRTINTTSVPVYANSMANPFTIKIEQPVLDDLKLRLQNTRFPDHIPGSGWDYGTEASCLQA